MRFTRCRVCRLSFLIDSSTPSMATFAVAPPPRIISIIVITLPFAFLVFFFRVLGGGIAARFGNGADDRRRHVRQRQRRADDGRYQGFAPVVPQISPQLFHMCSP